MDQPIQQRIAGTARVEATTAVRNTWKSSPQSVKDIFRKDAESGSTEDYPTNFGLVIMEVTQVDQVWFEKGLWRRRFYKLKSDHDDEGGEAGQENKEGEWLP